MNERMKKYIPPIRISRIGEVGADLSVGDPLVKLGKLDALPDGEIEKRYFAAWRKAFTDDR